AELRTEVDKLKAARANQQKQAQEIEKAWALGLKDFLVSLDPCDADPAFPLLLLPVRLETRYSADHKTLRIRIFPDDIHVDQLDHGVTDAEAAASKAYWTSTWQKPDGDPALDAAWTILVDAVAGAPAPGVARARGPNTRMRGGAPPPFPKPNPPLRRAAIARLLPDRFVAVAFQGTNRSAATGLPIPPELITGLLSDDGSPRV